VHKMQTFCQRSPGKIIKGSMRDITREMQSRAYKASAACGVRIELFKPLYIDAHGSTVESNDYAVSHGIGNSTSLLHSVLSVNVVEEVKSK
jgi:hypothetical protein